MTNSIHDNQSEKYPGQVREYGIFWRPADSIAGHNPNAWKRLGRPSTEHDAIREMLMPIEMQESNLYGVGWIDDGIEYKILERTVTRSEWRTESKRDK